MSITTGGHEKIKDYLQGLIAGGNYTRDGTVYPTSIYKTERSGDMLTFYLFIPDGVAGTITRFQLIDTDGALFDDQPDSIVKPDVNGLLVAFKYTLRKV